MAESHVVMEAWPAMALMVNGGRGFYALVAVNAVVIIVNAVISIHLSHPALLYLPQQTAVSYDILPATSLRECQ